MLPDGFSPLAGICAAITSRRSLARYAFDETSAHLLNNRTKSAKDYNERFELNLLQEKLIMTLFCRKLLLNLQKKKHTSMRKRLIVMLLM